jgi:hypothetical protein
MKEFSLNEGWVITMNQEDEIIAEGGKIHVRPAWKWDEF